MSDFFNLIEIVFFLAADVPLIDEGALSDYLSNLLSVHVFTNWGGF